MPSLLQPTNILV